MKKRILSMLLILCLVIGIISTAAFAASEVTVKIYRNGHLSGTFSEENHDYYYHNDSYLIDDNPTGANAVMDFSTNTLTLNNLDLTGRIKVEGGNITVVLNGTNRINYIPSSITDPNWLILCEDGGLEIKGTGSLELSSSNNASSAIHAEGTIKISDGAKIEGTITNNAQVISGGNVIITGAGTSVKATVTGNGCGINVSNSSGTTLTVDNGATLEAVSANGTALKEGTILSVDEGSTVTVGESAPGSAWDGETNITTYKYVKIVSGQGGGTTSTTYEDYTITSNDQATVAGIMSGVADVTAAGGVITIKLTSNINGRIRFDDNAGNFVLDLNGKTIDTDATAANEYGNETICADNNFTGTVTITGSGTLKKGRNHIVYVGGNNTVKFALQSGYDYYTVKVDGADKFDTEKLTETKTTGYSNIDGTSLVLTQCKNSLSADVKWGASADALTGSGSGSGSIADALAAAPAYIQLQQDVTLSDTAVGNTMTVDLNGFTLAVPAGKTATVAAEKALTVINTKSTGGLVVAGNVIANGSLDISSLTYGIGGLIKEQGGKLNIGADGLVKLVPEWVSGDPNAFVVLGTPGEGAYLILGSKAYQYRSSAWVLINKEPMYNTYIDKLYMGILVDGFAVPDGATDYGVIIDGTKYSKKSPIQGGNYVVEIEGALDANTGYIAKPYYTKDDTDTYGLSFYFTTAQSRTALPRTSDGYVSYHNRDYYAYAGGKAAIGYGEEESSNGGAVDFIGNNGTNWLGSTYRDGGWAYKFEGSNWSSNWIETHGPKVSVYGENGIQAWAVPTTSDDGNFGILTYYIRNASDTAISGVRFGAAADIKVGGEDYAPIEKTHYGISMTDGDNAFVLICRSGILDYVDSPVSTLWFGSYTSARESVFNNASGNSYSGDSAAAYSWQNISLAPGEVKSFRIAIGLGDSDTLAGLTSGMVNVDNAGAFTATTAPGVGDLAESLKNKEGYTNAGTIDVLLTVTEKDSSAAGAAEIKETAPDKTYAFVDLALTASVDGAAPVDIGDTNTKILTITLPFNKTGKYNVRVYRFHDVDNYNTVDADEVAEIPWGAANAVDGEYCEILSNKIILHVKKFSLYSIGYSSTAKKVTIDASAGTKGYVGQDVASASNPTGAIDLDKAVSMRYTDTGVELTDSEKSQLAGYEFTSTNYVKGDPTGEYDITVGWSGISAADQLYLEDQYIFTFVGGKLTIGSIPYIGHTCDSYCTICSACKDAACTESACRNKCKLVGMNFTDVAAGQWYTEAVEYVYHHGLMDGVGGNKFDVKGTLSRAMIVQILYNAEGRPVVSSASVFSDVKNGAWYSDAIAWANMKGIVEGYNGKFNPSDAVTREQLAAILWRYAKYKGYDVSVGEDTNILSYEDVFSISEYAIPAMQWACGAGIFEGDGVKLTPKTDATRGQAAALLMRFCEKTAK